MKNYFWICFLIFSSLFISNCASTYLTVQDTQSFPKPPDDKGIIYFYRPSAFAGAAVSYDIRLNDNIIGAVRNGTYFYKMLEPGSYVFWARTEAKKEINMEIESGKNQYIKCGVGWGFFVGHPKFSVVPEVTGKNEIKGCKYAVPK